MIKSAHAAACICCARPAYALRHEQFSRGGMWRIKVWSHGRLGHEDIEHKVWPCFGCNVWTT